MLNRVTLIGHLGRKPELKTLESGVALARFSVATNESFKDRDGNWQTDTEWHEIIVWRELATRAEKQLDKGLLVYVEGKLNTRKYTDAAGVERKVTEIVASTIRVLDKKDAPKAAETHFDDDASDAPF
jgi:single-strand DNA-binding protein